MSLYSSSDMFDQKLDGAIVDWLEEIPLDELPNEYTKSVIKSFRKGHTPVSEAIETLRIECSEELEKYVKQNVELSSLFEDLEEE